MAKIDNDDVSNNSGNPSFQEIVEARLSRRGFLGGGLAAAAAFSFSGVNALLRSVPASAQDIGQVRFDHCWAFKACRFLMQIPS
jgi:secreted PhoX family phosphatase